MTDLGRWLAALGLERYAPAFEENDIDARLLRELTDADLVAIGIRSLGHRKRILAAIAELAGEAAVAEAPAAPTVRHRAPAAPQATRSIHGELGRSLPPALREAIEERGYELEDTLGRGGMGEVYLARQTAVDREVAIKVLQVHPDGDAAQRFAREARAVAALRHPHSVRLYDYVTTRDGAACIVMEHVAGDSLWTVLRRERRLPLERIVPILVQICGALSEAHEMGIVHRDIKPGNVLLQEVDGYRDFVRVLDFGLARWLSMEESRLTRTGHVFGTPRYLSPEQIQGAEVTPRSDLYSLGVLLYEALAGEPPFGGEIDASLMFKHMKEAPPTLPADVPRPASVDRLLERLLAKAPALRPPSAAALRDELAGVLSRRPAELVSPAAVRALATERRQIVALHVAYFDEALFGALPDDAAHELVRRCDEIVEAVVRRRGGFRNGRTRHGSEIVLGAPVARRDDVGRALDAALDACERLSEIGDPAVAPRVGVADGRAVAGAVRKGPDAGYVVSGEPCETAAALAARAEPGEIRIAPSLVERATVGFTCTSAPEGVVLIGRRREDSEGQKRPFVGRRAELERLVGLLEDAQAPGSRPRGHVVVIAGEAGIGKSRLVDRLLAEARRLGVRSARGLIFDVEVARGQGAMHQVIDALLDLPEDASDRTSAVERRIGIGSLRPEQWPFLYHFLGIALPGAMQRVYDAMEPAALKDGYRGMLAALLASETREAPLLCVLEDVHWADRPTLDAIEMLCSLATSMRLVLVLTSRVEGEEGWRHALVGHGVTRLELEPLAQTDARELLVRLGITQSGDLEAVVDRAAGHPLLLTELARSGPRRDRSLPHSVEGLVHERVDRLPELDRAAIQLASVLGPRFRLSELREVLGARDYDPSLLEDYRLLRAEGPGTFMFTHALVRDAVYGSLVESRRRELHERCADRLSGDLALCATHLERARSAQAPPAYLAAAEAALADHRYDDARSLLGRGLLVGDGSAAVPALLERLGHVELLLGRALASVDAFRSLREVARDDTDVFRASVGLGAALRVASRYDEALAALEVAEEAAARAGLPAAQVHHIRGNVCFATGELVRCRESHEKALAIATETGDVELRARALSGLADAHYGEGRLESAARTWQACIELARAEELLGVEATNLPMLAIAHVFLDQAERAGVLAAQAVDLTHRLSRKRDEALARGAASLAALVRGDFDEALVQGERALAITRAIGTVVFEETGHYYVARALLGLGRRDEARAQAEQGLALCRERGMYFVGAALLATLARLATDDAERDRLLDEGESVLGPRSLSFNRFWFHENAIAAALAAGDVVRARRHAQALADATRAEPVPLMDRLCAQVREARAS